MRIVKDLATPMRWKTAVVVVISFGGIKGGIDCDPCKLSEKEPHSVTCTFVSQIQEFSRLSVLDPERPLSE